MSEPTTAAGRALTAWAASDARPLQEFGYERVLDAILDAEAEAREAGRREALTGERLTEALSAADAALQTMGCPWGCDGPEEPPCDVHVFLAAHAEQASEPEDASDD